MELDRREFLRLLGVTTTATAIGVIGAQSLFSVPDKVFKRAVQGPHIETWKNSICSMCPGGCGIRVRLIDDIPVRVTGNPLYPVNKGALCPMAEAGIEMLFHPDRIKQPVRKISKDGKITWQPITWDEASKMIAARLSKLQEQHKAEKFVTLLHDNNDLLSDFTEQFMFESGSVNFINLSDSDLISLPPKITQGYEQPPVYDLANSNFVLNFGGDFLDKSPSPMYYSHLYENFNSGNGNARIIHISSYLSRTAANSSEWYPIKAGTSSALALAIAHVMIRDRSYDKQFIKDYCFGFSNWKDSKGSWHKGFKTLVLEEYSPEKTSKITGLPANRILKLARDFASAQPALAVAGGHETEAANSFYNSWSVYCLNALKGNLNKEGGVLFPPKMESAFHANQKLIKTKNLQKKSINMSYLKHSDLSLNSIGHLVSFLEKEQEAIDTLLIYNTDPVFESNNQEQLKHAFEKIPFIVSCTSFFDKTSEFADLILPTPVFLEKWEVSLNNPIVEFAHLGIQQPVIKPIYNTRHFGDILLQISGHLGGRYAKSFPWKDYKNFIRGYTQKYYESGKGTIVSKSVDLSWIEYLKKRGWAPFEYSTFDEFWDVLLEKGGWWNPEYNKPQYKTIFKTDSGKFEFYSQAMRNEILKLAEEDNPVLRKKQAYSPGWQDISNDIIYLPHFEETGLEKDDTDYPYSFLSFPLLANSNKDSSHLGLLQELAGLHSHEYWNPWIEINPETAARQDIIEGDYVRVISPKGQISAKAKVLPTVMPETIMMSYGHFRKNQGTNPREIFAAETDMICGIQSFISTKVRIEKLKTREFS